MDTPGKRIAHIRSELKLSQEQFAVEIGVKRKSSVSGWENDSGLPEVYTLMKIAELGKVSMDWILYGQDNFPALNKRGIRYVLLDEELGESKIAYPEFPILSVVPAGIAEIKNQEYPEYKSLEYDSRFYFWLKVDDEHGFSMLPYLKPGDLVLCANEVKKINDGDIVAVLWDDSNGAIKILNRNHNLRDVVILDSLNPSERTITLKRSQIKAIYKVVLISKV